MQSNFSFSKRALLGNLYESDESSEDASLPESIGLSSGFRSMLSSSCLAFAKLSRTSSYRKVNYVSVSGLNR